LIPRGRTSIGDAGSWRGINDESGRMLNLLLLLVAAYAGFDLIRTLRTGRARTRITTVTRKHQPARYWRYVLGHCRARIFCGGVRLGNSMARLAPGALVGARFVPPAMAPLRRNGACFAISATASRLLNGDTK
jgi:hypothetical protein